MGANRENGRKKESDEWRKSKTKCEMAKYIMKVLTKNRKEEERWIEMEGMNIQIRKEWEMNRKVLVLVINKSPGFAMRISGTI